MTWKLTYTKTRIKTKNATMIEGLPGIGNVGKIAVDYIVQESKAQKVCELSSHYSPNYVMVQENNLIEFPKLSIYHKKINSQDYFFLIGDYQPEDDIGTLKLCDTIIDFAKKNHVKEIITTGGIGLEEMPKTPKLFCTGNNKKIVDKYKDSKLSNNIYGIVGPIMGVSGILLGLAEKAKINALCILVQTTAAQILFDIKGSSEMIKILDQKFKLRMDIKKLKKDIKKINETLQIGEEIFSKAEEKTAKHEINYIG